MTVSPPATVRRRQRARGVALLPSLGLVPFLLYLTVFLVVPTVTVLVGSVYRAETGFSFARLRALGDGPALDALRGSMELSAASAAIGAVLGAVLSWLIVSAAETNVLRRIVLAACGVLAQFGGVTLAFAFIATLGFGGLLTTAWADLTGGQPDGVTWLYELPGLVLVYTYFQIPLMVIVFLPALEGLQPQWREAARTLGATPWRYWWHVGLPLLRPAFLGATLLLFANAFAAYATAAALVSQGAPITPLLIRSALTSEIVLGQADFGYALALEMVVVVAVVMVGYSWLLKRTSRWLS